MLADRIWDVIHVVVRKPDQVLFRSNPRVNQIVVPDMSKMATDEGVLELIEKSQGRVDAAVITLGVNEPFGWTTQKLVDVEWGLTSKFVTLCSSQLRVKYIGLLSLDSDHSPLTKEELATEISWWNIVTLAPKVKGMVEEAVISSKVPVVSIFRPANFETDEYRFGAIDFFLQWMCTLVNPLIPSKYHSIHVKDIARAISRDAAAAMAADSADEATVLVHYYDEMMASVR